MRTSAFVLVLPLVIACKDGGPDLPPAPVQLRTLTLTAGPAWNPDLPPEEQDLAAHFATVGERFAEGQLLAYGPRLDTGLGFYVYLDDTAPDNAALLADDPGIANGVLALEEEATWALAIDLLDGPADSVFILDYHAGPDWVPGVPLALQDLDDHMAYIESLVVDGSLLAGGPVNDTMGRYVVSAPDQAAAEALVAADPSVADGLFAPTVHPWGVLERQTVAQARAATP